MNEGDSIHLSDADRERVRNTVQKMNALAAVLKSVMPEAPDDEIGTVAHDIADYWELGVKHQDRVNELLSLSNHKDRQKLAELLSDLIYGDKVELTYHIESMDATLPRIIKRLESER